MPREPQRRLEERERVTYMRGKTSTGTRIQLGGPRERRREGKREGRRERQGGVKIERGEQKERGKREEGRKEREGRIEDRKEWR